MKLEDGVPCSHKGCLNHVTHPCEGCGRIAGRHEITSIEKDAKRYQYMRNNACFQDRNGPGLYWYLPRFDHQLPLGERLDKAIDSELEGLLK